MFGAPTWMDSHRNNIWHPTASPAFQKSTNSKKYFDVFVHDNYVALDCTYFYTHRYWGQRRMSSHYCVFLEFACFGHTNCNKPTTALNQVVNLINYSWAELMWSTGTTTKTTKLQRFWSHKMKLDSYLTGWY